MDPMLQLSLLVRHMNSLYDALNKLVDRVAELEERESEEKVVVARPKRGRAVISRGTV